MKEMFKFKGILNYRNRSESQLTKAVRCSRCDVSLYDVQIKSLDNRIYCNSRYTNSSKSEENAPTDVMVFITVMGGSYSGTEVYYDRDSKQLIGHQYIWHIDDGQGYTGWSDVSLDEVIRKLTSRKSFSIKSEEMKLLYEAFGSEVDSTLERIKNSNIEEG